MSVTFHRLGHNVRNILFGTDVLDIDDILDDIVSDQMAPAINMLRYLIGCTQLHRIDWARTLRIRIKLATSLIKFVFKKESQYQFIREISRPCSKVQCIVIHVDQKGKMKTVLRLVIKQ